MYAKSFIETSVHAVKTVINACSINSIGCFT